VEELTEMIHANDDHIETLSREVRRVLRTVQEGTRSLKEVEVANQARLQGNVTELT